MYLFPLGSARYRRLHVAELRSRMTEKTSRMCCVIGESMFFAEIEGTRRQSFDSFVFSHERGRSRRKNIRPRGIMGIGRFHSRPHLGYSLAGNIGSPEYPCIPARPAEDPDNIAGGILSENGVIDKLQSRREMVLGAGDGRHGRNAYHLVASCTCTAINEGSPSRRASSSAWSASAAAVERSPAKLA